MIEIIEIILDNQDEMKFSFDLYVRGFYVYKDVWSPLIGEEGFKRSHEKENKTYECATVVYRNDLFQRIIVEHVPMNTSKVPYFL